MRPCRSVWTYPLKLNSVLERLLYSCKCPAPNAWHQLNLFLLVSDAHFQLFEDAFGGSLCRGVSTWCLLRSWAQRLVPQAEGGLLWAGADPHIAQGDLGRTLHFRRSADIPRGGPCRFGYRCRSQLVQTHITGRHLERCARLSEPVVYALMVECFREVG